MPHTDGPWVLEQNERTERWEVRLGKSVEGGMYPVAHRPIEMPDLYPEDGAQYEEMLANARLIAAAPDLLAAIEGLVLEHDTQAAEDRRDAGMSQPWIGPCSCGSCDDARAAIVKALGASTEGQS